MLILSIIINIILILKLISDFRYDRFRKYKKNMYNDMISEFFNAYVYFYNEPVKAKYPFQKYKYFFRKFETKYNIKYADNLVFLFFVKDIFEPVLIIIEPNDNNELCIKVQSYIGADEALLYRYCLGGGFCDIKNRFNYHCDYPHLYSITEEVFESCMQKEEYIKYFMDFLEDKERLFKYLRNIVLYYVANGNGRIYTRKDFLTYQDLDKIIDTVVEQLYDITSEYIKRVYLK